MRIFSRYASIYKQSVWTTYTNFKTDEIREENRHKNPLIHLLIRVFSLYHRSHSCI